MLFICLLFLASLCSLATGISFQINYTVAAEICNTSCSFFTPSLWSPSTGFNCALGEDTASIYTTDWSSTYPFLYLDRPCNLSAISSTVNAVFVVKEKELFVGTLYYQSSLEIQSGASLTVF